ncbi:unnamed protein product [Arctia plantaginis]|uniref:Uncharacterized protein n=1 Tax=Arctia plantaginis TaxID=874455 RepID=A0A8S1B462_ARCPL|nr:unnamed protein product [Arctia plantaginis]
MALCAGCKQSVQNRERLICTLCKSAYDLECANVTRERFNLMTRELKKALKCQACRCKMPKGNNTNTPIRQQELESALTLNTPEEKTNITIRKRVANTICDSMDSADQCLLGDTLYAEGRDAVLHTQTELTLQNFNELIIQRLKENNNLIITELKHTLHNEIRKAIGELREEVERKFQSLSTQNEQRIEDMKQINSEINKLILENETLKQEIKNLSPSEMTSSTIKCTETNTRK